MGVARNGTLEQASHMLNPIGPEVMESRATNSSAKALRDTLIIGLLVASAVGYLFLCVVVPRIAHEIVLERRTIPLPTQALFAISAFATKYWWILASGVALSALGIARWFRSDPKGLEATGGHLRRHAPVYALVG